MANRWKTINIPNNYTQSYNSIKYTLMQGFQI